MIKSLALLLLGWKRAPSWIVPRCADYITVFLRERGIARPDRLSFACRLALSQHAYWRAANMGAAQQPRFRHYVRELELVSCIVADALDGGSVDDDRVRGILSFHRAI